jgi:hypothetical protein
MSDLQDRIAAVQERVDKRIGTLLDPATQAFKPGMNPTEDEQLIHELADVLAGVELAWSEVSALAYEQGKVES